MNFDWIQSTMLLHETSFKSMQAIFDETQRLLAPGGVVLHVEQRQYSDDMPLFEPAMRERLDTVERLLERNATITRADIDSFEPTKTEADHREQWPQEYLARILRVLRQDHEAIDANDQYSEDVAEELAKG